MIYVRTEERRPPTIFNSLLLFCVYFVLLYMGNIEFKIDSQFDSKLHSKTDSKLNSKKDSRFHSMFYNMPILHEYHICLSPGHRLSYFFHQLAIEATCLPIWVVTTGTCLCKINVPISYACDCGISETAMY